MAGWKVDYTWMCIGIWGASNMVSHDRIGGEEVDFDGKRDGDSEGAKIVG